MLLSYHFGQLPFFKRHINSDQQIQLMKSRVNSAPRMQQVYTPRVKDGRNSNDSPQIHYYNKTTTKVNNPNPSLYQNPEGSPVKDKSKPAQQKLTEPNAQELINQKISLENNKNVVPQKYNKIVKEELGKQIKGNKQQTIYGRRLQYPATDKVAGAYDMRQNRPESVQLQRSNSMYSSRHFVDRATKSSSIKEKKAQFDQKFKVAFGHLLDQNQAYLKQRRRACMQKARPKDQIFKIERPTITTTHKDQFFQKDTYYAQHMAPRAQTFSNSFGPTKVCGNSTTNEFHSGKQGPRADLAQWPDGYKLQGPLFGVTSYANQFPHPGDYQKMIPIAKFNQHPRGFPHTANSTSRTFHKGDFTKRADLATWNNLHPYGNGFSPDRGTTYGTKHNFKQQTPIQQWPMHDPQLIKTDGKFTTQYGTKLIDPTSHQLNPANYCECGRKAHLH